MTQPLPRETGLSPPLPPLTPLKGLSLWMRAERPESKEPLSWKGNECGLSTQLRPSSPELAVGRRGNPYRPMGEGHVGLQLEENRGGHLRTSDPAGTTHPGHPTPEWKPAWLHPGDPPPLSHPMPSTQ